MLFTLLIGFILFIIVLSIHEFAHAWMADKLGDPTPRIAGRLTLDPRAHIDPVGTILLPLFLQLSGSSLIFGWAKPTPFDPFNLKNPKRDAALIAFAGPLSNLVMAILGSLVLRFMIYSPLYFPAFWGELTVHFITLNVLLALFNLVPIHPLDGFKVVGGLLPERYYKDWMALSRYGMLFLALLLLPIFGSSPVFTLLSPLMNFILSVLLPTRGGGVI